MPDFIPHSDSDFDDWQDNFVTKVNTYKSGWGLSVDALAEWTLLTVTAGDKKDDWTVRWAKVKSGGFEHSDVVFKNTARQSYESGDVNNPLDTSLRLFNKRYIANNPKVTDGQKADIGTTIVDEKKSPAPGVDGTNALREVTGQILKNEHLYQLSLINTPGVKSLAKGEGVDAIEVWMAFTAAGVKEPPAIDDYRPDGEASDGHYKRQFEEGQEDWKAWYKARKRFKGKTKTWGPFCNPWSGTIS